MSKITVSFLLWKAIENARGDKSIEDYLTDLLQKENADNALEKELQTELMHRDEIIALKDEEIEVLKEQFGALLQEVHRFTLALPPPTLAIPNKKKKWKKLRFWRKS